MPLAATVKCPTWLSLWVNADRFNNISYIFMNKNAIKMQNKENNNNFFNIQNVIIYIYS